MPRPNTYGDDDRGADSMSSARRSTSSSRYRGSTVSSASSHDESKRNSEQEAVDADLTKWENRLASEVDQDLFDAEPDR